MTPTVLLILDGWGMAPEKKGTANAITFKTAPNFFRWKESYPYTEIEASGEAVGLMKGQEGNSEAGHLNIGGGRVVKQDTSYILEAIKDNSFFKNSAFHQALAHVKKHNSNVHLMGLLSNSNSAHSYPEHVYALLAFLYREGVKNVFLHLFTDGRDSGQHDALKHLKKLEDHFLDDEKIATIMGRFYAMDRNKVWERTEAAFEAMVLGKGKEAKSAEAAISMAYNSNETDEFISPTVIMENDKPVATISDNDAVIFFNLRSDRARQLTKAFVQPDFYNSNPGSFHRPKKLKNVNFVAMTDFGPDLPDIHTAFPSRDVKNGLVQTLCPVPQLYVAESEKFAHVTYFLNGGFARHFCSEEWIKIDSDHVKDFVTTPKMKAKEIAECVIAAVESGKYGFIAANFANADMVGHTGNLAATEIAVGEIDYWLHQISKAVHKKDGWCIATADHGNAEEMINAKTGEIDSEHSTNPVPFVISALPSRLKSMKLPKKLKKGKLCDVAPTILKLMGIKQPQEMTGKPLF